MIQEAVVAACGFVVACKRGIHPRSWAILFGLATLSNSAWATTDPVATQQLPPIEVILQKWSAQMHLARPRQVHFTRIVYDRTFCREERGTGSLALDQAGHGRFLLAPSAIPENIKSRSRDGVRYELEPSSPVEWYWTDTTVYQLNPTDMSVGRVHRYESRSFVSVFQNPKSMCPLLLGLDTSDHTTPGALKWELNQDWKRRNTEIYLTARPRQNGIRDSFGAAMWYANCSRIDVLIDRQSYETIGLRFADLSGNHETVYVIERINDIDGEFWQPDLTDYRPLPAVSDSMEGTASDGE